MPQARGERGIQRAHRARLALTRVSARAVSGCRTRTLHSKSHRVGDFLSRRTPPRVPLRGALRIEHSHEVRVSRLDDASYYVPIEHALLIAGKRKETTRSPLTGRGVCVGTRRRSRARTSPPPRLSPPRTTPRRRAPPRLACLRAGAARGRGRPQRRRPDLRRGSRTGGADVRPPPRPRPREAPPPPPPRRPSTSNPLRLRLRLRRGGPRRVSPSPRARSPPPRAARTPTRPSSPPRRRTAPRTTPPPPPARGRARRRCAGWARARSRRRGRSVGRPSLRSS
mmetsp:Transcript_2391/g.9935  ORF Transcript_2391/g.9935 Transcript_2391/m.9935 type:complete len:282 (+) Transcript_2391:841-1686(+)